MEYKSTQAHIEVKKADGDVLKIRAYALAFGNLDSTGDIIMPSACDKWLAGEMASRVALCYQHELDKVIGKITDKGVDDKGLWIEAEVLPTSLGKDVQILLSHGAVKEFSIGYSADEYHYGKTEDAEYEIRYLDAITIFEVSPVTIAANPKATLVSTSKSHPEAQGDDPENENSHTKDTDMPEITLQEKAEKMQAELKTAVEQANEAKAAAAKLSTDIEKANESIDNLDKSVKELKSENENLRKQLESKDQKSFDSELLKTLEDNRKSIDNFVSSENKQYGTLSFKFTTANITGTSLGIQQDPTVHSDKIAALAFYNRFRKVERAGNIIEWLEGSDTDNTGYVGEFTAPSTANAYSITGKTRQFAKLASFIEVSQETTDWFNLIYQWARTTGIQRILKKADQLIWSGDGNDSSAKSHVYGIKTQGNTAFAATGAKYSKATVADVILDAIAQIKAKGYVANTVFVPFALEAQIRGLKDANGNYLYNQLTGMLGQVQVIPTVELGASELVVCDDTCVEIYERGNYELELERVAGKDGYNVWLRKALQVKVPAAEKKGVVYVSNVATAISAITADAS